MSVYERECKINSEKFQIINFYSRFLQKRLRKRTVFGKLMVELFTELMKDVTANISTK